MDAVVYFTKRLIALRFIAGAIDGNIGIVYARDEYERDRFLQG